MKWGSANVIKYHIARRYPFGSTIVHSTRRVAGSSPPARSRLQLRNQALTIAWDLLEDPVLIVEGFAPEKELRDPPIDVSGDIEMDVRRSHSGASLRGIRPRLDRKESEPPLLVAQLIGIPLKVGIKWRRVRIGRVIVATECVRLPELNPAPATGSPRALSTRPTRSMTCPCARFVWPLSRVRSLSRSIGLMIG